MKTLQNLNKHIHGSRRYALAAILAIAASAFFGLLQPQILRIVIDVGLGGKEWDGSAWIGRFVESLGGRETIRRWILPAALTSVLLMGLSGFFLYLKGRWASMAAEDTAKRIRNRLYRHIQNLPYGYHSGASTGDLIQRCTSDVETIRSFLATQAVEIGRGLFLVAFTAVIMARIDVLLTLVSMAVIPALFLFGYVFFLRVKYVFGESDEAEGRLSSTLQENITGIRVVRAFARQEHEMEKYDEQNQEFRDKTYRLIRLLAWYWSVSDVLCFLQIGLVMGVGGYWASTGRISLGTAVLFFTYVGRLLWPVRQMGRILTEMGKSVVSLGRIQEILDEEPEKETGFLRQELQGNVEFRDVWFSYESDKPVLKGMSFQVNAGEVVAILGPTGSGKSTLASLIPRLHDPDRGSVLIDGVPSLDWERRYLREQVGIILQEPFLFNRTVEDNITLAASEAKSDEIQDVVGDSALNDVIKGFEKGYETMVGEGGITLSGGQKQRMALARTLIRKPSVIIMDDSLSAVDAETDALIRRRLKSRFGNATVFLIAHRISTLQAADRILVLGDGKIVQQGRHEELIVQDGLYRRIWEIQNAGAGEVAS